LSSDNASKSSSAPPGAPARVLLLLLDGYRVALAPLLGGHCRFWPSCSAYAEEAIRRYGALRGVGLAARRLLRCHPFGAAGFDPVPWKADDDTAHT
jgi:putative membrane protein insertion efficiency factor